MDPDTTQQADLSCKFIDFIVGPFYKALKVLLPDAACTCDTLGANRAEWGRVRDELAKASS
jgi:hypothetical protein